jgi:hypothetical protein
MMAIRLISMFIFIGIRRLQIIELVIDKSPGMAEGLDLRPSIQNTR